MGGSEYVSRDGWRQQGLRTEAAPRALPSLAWLLAFTEEWVLLEGPERDVSPSGPVAMWAGGRRVE